MQYIHTFKRNKKKKKSETIRLSTENNNDINASDDLYVGGYDRLGFAHARRDLINKKHTQNKIGRGESSKEKKFRKKAFTTTL